MGGGEPVRLRDGACHIARLRPLRRPRQELRQARQRRHPRRARYGRRLGQQPLPLRKKAASGSSRKEQPGETKRKIGSRRGRPPLPLPQPIGRPMEEIARVVLDAPPRREEEWEYLREHRAAREARKAARKV